MPNTRCDTCHNSYAWTWEDAFNKFGFGDGDAQIMTDTVAKVLEAAGYRCELSAWLLHNIVIASIKDSDGREVIPNDANVGYDHPRKYLPDAIVALLDTKLPEHGEAVS